MAINGINQFQAIQTPRTQGGRGAMPRFDLDTAGTTPPTTGKDKVTISGASDQADSGAALADQMRMRSISMRSAQFIQQSDSDGDHLLSSEELGIEEEAFTQLDQNQDGAVDLTELNFAARQMQNQIPPLTSEDGTTTDSTTTDTTTVDISTLIDAISS